LAIDFITELPLLENFNQLWVVINQFTKMEHFIPLARDKKMVADLVVVFAKEIWKHHGIPADIVSDRDLQFTSETWK